MFFLGVQPNTDLEQRLLSDGYLSAGYNPLSLTPWNIKKLLYNPAPLNKIIAKACLTAWDKKRGSPRPAALVRQSQPKRHAGPRPHLRRPESFQRPRSQLRPRGPADPGKNPAVTPGGATPHGAGECRKGILAGFRPRTARSFCFGKRTQNQGRPGAALRVPLPRSRLVWAAELAALKQSSPPK